MGLGTVTRVDIGEAVLAADVEVPGGAEGVVLFAHGSGSSRMSPRNRMVAERLRGLGFATVLTDLLTRDEERVDQATGQLRFDIALLARRLTEIVDWMGGQPGLERLPLGLFGASTGAAAALLTAMERPERVRAVVSRGGRVDLAGDRLSGVTAPTLLIVGEYDDMVLRLNEAAATQLGGVSALRIVPGATHLFTEAGALEQVAGAAAEWFEDHLAAREVILDGYPPSPEAAGEEPGASGDGGSQPTMS